MSYHSHSNWHWERLPDGGVRIVKIGSTLKDVTLDEHIVTAETWASIVASVSKGGEENGRFYDALAFHGKDVPA
ncbi:MAG: hypothetical protein ABL998_00875 [Planctomycetota bacterium]